MTITRRSLIAASPLALLAGCGQAKRAPEHFEVNYTDGEWRKKLTSAQYATLRQEATDPPFHSPYWDDHRAGLFSCAGCALPLFQSATKYDSGTGWPSFFAPLANAVRTREDGSFGTSRIEVHCRRCGGHLGHVFDDGPQPTGKRYCIDGTALVFAPKAA